MKETDQLKALLNSSDETQRQANPEHWLPLVKRVLGRLERKLLTARAEGNKFRERTERVRRDLRLLQEQVDAFLHDLEQ